MNKYMNVVGTSSGGSGRGQKGQEHRAAVGAATASERSLLLRAMLLTLASLRNPWLHQVVHAWLSFAMLVRGLAKACHKVGAADGMHDSTVSMPALNVASC